MTNDKYSDKYTAYYAKFEKFVLNYIMKHGDTGDHEVAGRLISEFGMLEAEFNPPATPPLTPAELHQRAAIGGTVAMPRPAVVK